MTVLRRRACAAVVVLPLVAHAAVPGLPAPGPYPVGVTERTFLRPDLAGPGVTVEMAMRRRDP